MTDGHLVVVEGIDGVGKSTVVDGLADALRSAGVDARTTREPTDTYRGTALRRSLSDPDAPASAEALLFMADHVAHVADLDATLSDAPETVVVSDRYATSCYAYQGALLEEPLAEAGVEDPVGWIRDAIGPFHRDPDLTILLDLPVDEALDRVRDRDDADDKFERADLLETVRGRYLDLAERFPWVEIVDAAGTPEETLEAAQGLVDELLG